MIVVSNDCTGCGICADTAPAIFKVGDDGIAKVLDQNADKAKAQEAADACPVSAISIK